MKAPEGRGSVGKGVCTPNGIATMAAAAGAHQVVPDGAADSIGESKAYPNAAHRHQGLRLISRIARSRTLPTSRAQAKDSAWRESLFICSKVTIEMLSFFQLS